MGRKLQLVTAGMLIFVAVGLPACLPGSTESIPDDPLKALIIDGQNNHRSWPKTTMMMKDYLEQTGLFEVEVERSAFTWNGSQSPDTESEIGIDLLDKYPLRDGKTYLKVDSAKYDEGFNPDFSKYDVVVSNFGWLAKPWPETTQRAFEKYVSSGGGLVIVHAANNCFGDWLEYNKMIGLGGWGDRDAESGPYVFYDNAGKLVRDPGEGICGSHGPQHEFVIKMRDSQHPITRGIPATWLHTEDELYETLRGPAENMTILATAYSDVEKYKTLSEGKYVGTGRHEPMLMTIKYGDGRVFHTTLGHSDYSLECVGFITTFQRGAEWAAKGTVSQEVPVDFPRADKSSSRAWK